MIKITIEMLPSWGGPPYVLAEGFIVNDGTGTRTSGNYFAKFGGKGKRMHSPTMSPSWRRSTVQRYPRLRLPVWHLLARALKEANIG